MSANLLTFSSLARKLDLSQPRAFALLRAGVIKPDSHAGRIMLFDPARLPEIQSRVSEALNAGAAK